MTRPSEQWPALWQLFMVLHQDYEDDFDSEDEALADQVESTPTDELQQALDEWHAAFDDIDNAAIDANVRQFNGSYNPSPVFGGYRGWAEWVRQHIESELSRRGDSASTAD